MEHSWNTNSGGGSGTPGPPGPQGPQGPQGEPGEGVPPGGTTGQVLKKVSGADYDTEWATGGAGGLDAVVDDPAPVLNPAHIVGPVKTKPYYALGFYERPTYIGGITSLCYYDEANDIYETGIATIPFNSNSQSIKDDGTPGTDTDGYWILLPEGFSGPVASGGYGIAYEVRASSPRPGSNADAVSIMAKLDGVMTFQSSQPDHIVDVKDETITLIQKAATGWEGYEYDTSFVTMGVHPVLKQVGLKFWSDPLRPNPYSVPYMVGTIRLEMG